jgi:hypothetical protein
MIRPMPAPSSGDGGLTLPRRTWVICALLLLASFLLLYGPAFDNGFMLDDYLCLKNAHFAAQSAHYALAPWFPGFLRPVSQAYFSLEYRLFGFDPRGYLAANALLHLLVTGMVVLLTVRLTRHHGKALLAGLLFLSGWGHHGKGVIWISDAFGLLTALLYAGCVLAHLESDTPGLAPGRRRLLRGAGFVLFAAALFSKESALSLLPVLALAAWSLRTTRRVDLRPLLPHAVLLLVYVVVVRFAVQRPMLHEVSPVSVPRMLLDTVRYLTLAFFPVQSSPLIAGAGGLPGLLLSVSGAVKVAIAVGLGLGLVLILRVRHPAHRFLALAAALAVLPYTAVPQEERWLNLRYLYLPSLFLVPLLSSLVLDLLVARRRSRIRTAVVFGLPMVMIVQTTYVLRRLEARYQTLGYRVENLEDLREQCGGELVPPGEDGPAER